MNFVDNVDEHENIENEIKNMQNANERWDVNEEICV